MLWPTFTERIGADALWTGHYARVVRRNGMHLVARGVDASKDQSYMLATVDPALLDRVAFPLGSETKADVRREAEGAGLAAARRPESQEACFLAGDDYRNFLHANGLESSPGDIVDEAGTVLGHHDGLWRFTPGQRRGVGVVVAGAAPRAALRPRVQHARGGAAQRARRAARHCVRSPLRLRRRGRCEASLPVSGGRRGGYAHRGRIRRSSFESRSTQSLRARWPCSTTVTSSWEQA